MAGSKSKRKWTLTSQSKSSLTLPTELWYEILARLPIKSLLKFRSVSKPWCSIIDSPHFFSLHYSLSNINRSKFYLLTLQINPHRRTTPPHPSLVLRHVSSFKKSMDISKFPRLSRKVDIEIKGYVNGLMLVLWKREELMLWNPSIRKSILIPHYSSCYLKSKIDLVFDSSCDDYKVVVFDFDAEMIHVYGLSMGCWYTKLIDGVLNDGWIVGSDCVFFQGAVYLLADNETVGKFMGIVCFDCVTETISLGELPKGDFDVKSKAERRFLSVLRDSLALFDACYKGSCVWMMEKEGASTVWIKRYEISCSMPLFCPTFVDDGEDGLLLCEVLYHSWEFRCYDVVRKKLKHSMNIPRGLEVLFVDSYVESLVLARGLGDQTSTSLLVRGFT